MTDWRPVHGSRVDLADLRSEHFLMSGAKGSVVNDAVLRDDTGADAYDQDSPRKAATR